MKHIFIKPQLFILGLFLSAFSLNAQVPGTSLTFDGVNDYVNYTNLSSPAQFTVEAWVYPQKSGTDMSVVSNLSENSNFNMEIHIGPNGKPALTARSSSGWVDVVADNALNLNKWHHLAGTYDGATLSLYVNGTLAKSAVMTSYIRTVFTLRIGTRSGTSVPALYQYTGAIDEVRYWEVARTAAQIQQNMLKELSGGESGLLVYYKFDNQAGSTLSDARGLYNASLVSFALTGSTSNWTSSFALPATNISNTGFTASWQTIGMATKYRVDVSDKFDFSNLIVNNLDAGTATTYNLTGLSLNPGQTYYYRVRYETAYGTSSNSLPVSFCPAPGNAITLDGINDNIIVPQIATGLNEFTVETWINLSQPQTAAGHVIYSLEGWAYGMPHFQIWASSISFDIHSNTGASASYIFTPGKWYHVAATYSATGKLANIYINGVLVKSVVQSSVVNLNLTSARIGCWHNPNYSIDRWFNGKMDEFRIWDKVKTQAEIQAEMYKELTGSETGLRLYYNFNKGTGGGNNAGLTVIDDLATINSASPKNGTLENLTLFGNTSNYIVSGACAPIIFEANDITTNGFTANWNAATGATKYRIDISDRSDFSTLLASDIDAGTGTSFAVTGLHLMPGSTYYYRVRYKSASGISANSDAKTFMLNAGNALAMDGIDDFINITNGGWNISKVTMEAWVYWIPKTDNTQFIASKGEGKYEIHIGNGINNSLRFIPTTQVYFDAPAESLLPNQWNHIACSYDPTNAANNKIYINGTSVTITKAGSNPVTTPLVNDNTNFHLGARVSVGLHLNGKIDEFRLWNYIRSQSEIQNNMYNTLAGSESGLVVYNNFNQGVAGGYNTGLIAIPDLSQNGNSGIVINSILTGNASNYVASPVFNFVLDATSVSATGFTANWNQMPGATGYLIDVANNPDFTAPIITDSPSAAGTTSKSISGLSLLAGYSYYYRMRYTSASGTSSYSETKLLSYGTTLYNASKITPTGFTANWKAVAGATKYRIDVSDKSDFSNLLANNVDAGNGTSKTITGLNLELGTNYYYRLRYESASGTSGNSLAKTFMLGSGNSLHFDGANDYVDIGTLSPAGNFSTGFTYMGWIKYNSFNNWSRLFDFGNGQVSNNILLANNATTGTLYLDNYSGTTPRGLNTGIVMPLNQWTHIAVTINASGTALFYINGIQASYTGNCGIPANISRTKCYLGGSNWTTDSYFSGIMDNVSVWNRALSAAEIQNLQDSTFIGNETGLVAFYDFNQGVPNGYNKLLTTLPDATGVYNSQLNGFSLENERGSNYSYSGQSVNVFYVNASAASGGNGLTPATAFNNIAAAFAAASGSDTIKVAAGTYYQPAYNISFLNNSKSLTLLGGYNTNFTSCDPASNVTVISGSSGAISPIFNITNCNFTIKGIAVQNGVGSTSTAEGGAIHFAASNNFYNLNVDNCVFLNNKSTTGNGGAIWALISSSYTTSQVNITNCKFLNNTAANAGGAISIAYAKTTIKNCYFDNNRALTVGAVFQNYSSLELSNSTFTNNKAIGSDASAVQTNDANPVAITNNTFYGNYTTNNGTVRFYNSYGSLYHNTIVGNTAGSCAGAIVFYGSMNIFGNIIAGNVGTNGYSDVWNQSGTIADLGYNLYGATNGAQAAGFTMHATSRYIYTSELYKILESPQAASANQLFVAYVADNGGPTPTIKVIGRDLKNSNNFEIGNRIVPNTYNVTTDQRGFSRSLGGATIGAYEIDIPASEKVIYVNTNLAISGNGRTPATAYNNLTQAMAASNNDTLKLAGGVYTPFSTSYPIYNRNRGDYSYASNDIILFGGYNADFTKRDTALYRTSIEGKAEGYSTIYIVNCNLILDGITFQNSKNSGAPAFNYYTTVAKTVLVNNCIFQNNTTTNGGGAHVRFHCSNQLLPSRAKFTNCIVRNNLTNIGIASGGGLSVTDMNTVVENCSFYNNNSGALTIADTSEISNSTFVNNKNSYSGAINLGSGIHVLTNNTIVGNYNTSTSSNYIAGAECTSGKTIIQGNIIAGNYTANTSVTNGFDIRGVTSPGYFVDNGYNIFGINGANGVTLSPNSIIIPNTQLYNILESTDHSNTSARLFPAKVANNGAFTPTVKIIGKYFTDNSSVQKNIRQVPATVLTIIMPVKDQRGVARTFDAACIGAYETNPAEKYIYVNASAVSDGIGTFENPCKYLNTAITKASVTDTLLVAAGTYSAPSTSFVIDKSMALLGGYNANFTQRDPKANVSNIQYNTGTNPLVQITNASVELNGFTLQNSQSTVLGGAVLVSITDNKSYNLAFKNCVFYNNKASNGGGIRLDATIGSTNTSNVLITSCTFNGNNVTAYGGAVSSYGLFNTSIKNCTFYNNTASLNAGAVHVGQDGTMLLQQNTIVYNSCGTTTAGGGVSCDGGTLSLLANIIAKNSSSANKNNVYKAAGTVTNLGYNLLGVSGSNCMTAAAGTDSLSIPELDLLLNTTALANYGGTTPTMRLLKKLYTNNSSATKYINLVPDVVGINTLEVTDQRGVNREIGTSCIGAFEYRDTIQTNNIAVTSISANVASIHFTPGSFSKRVVFMKNGTETSELPVNGTTYIVNDVFGKGTQLSSSDWYCVYNGSDSVFTVSGLHPKKTYVLKAFEYNDVSYYHTTLPAGSNNPVSITTPKLVQTINFSVVNKKWGDAGFTLTDSTSLGFKPVIYKSSNAAVATVTGNTVHIVGVGATTIKANHAGNDTVAVAAEVSRGFQVLADTLFITATNTTSFYGNEPVFNFTASGLKNNDSIIAKVGVTYSSSASNTSNIGNYDVTPSAAVFAASRGTASNYILKYVNGTHIINPETLTIKAVNKTKTFGDANPPFTPISTGLKNSNVFSVQTYTTSATDFSNVGTYDIVPSNTVFTIGSATNYNIQYETGTLTITPAEVIVKASDTSKVYGTGNPAFKFVATGLKSPDAIGNVTYTTPANDSTIVGNYAITPSNALFSVGNSINYAIAYNTGNLTVTKSQLTITAKDTSRFYGDENPTAYAYKLSGLKFSDKMGSVSYTTTATQSSKTGNYDIVPSGATLSVGSNNYTLNYAKGTLVVKKAPVTVSANNITKVYGSKNPALAYSTMGLKLSDSIGSVALTCLADSASKVGTYTIVPSSAVFKTDVVDNYEISYTNGLLSIDKAPLTIASEDKSRPYFSKSNPDFTFTYSGFVNTDNESVLSSKPVAACSAVKTSLIGLYPITVSGAQAENYSITYVFGNLTITESPVQICMVSVDLETGKNMIVWERKRGFGVKQYNVYRENTELNNYQLIGSLPFNKEGVLVDSSSKPEEQQYRYKLSAVDTLGNESVLSNYHQPMFLQYNGNDKGINLIWEPYTIENGTMLFKSYKIMRGTDSTNLAMLITLPSGNTMHTDKDALALKYRMYYRLIGVLSSTCNSQSLLKAGGGPFIETVSNLEDNRLKWSIEDIIKGLEINRSMSIYPNPANDYLVVNFALKEASNVEFELCNLLGETIASYNVGLIGAGVSTNRIDLARFNLQNGIYYLKLKANSESGIKKVMISK